MIALDHVSVPDAPAELERTGRRIMLDRSYLEVGAVDEPLLFLRPGDVAEAARLLGREIKPYHGDDGEWLDVELAGPVLLTQRVDRSDWPPPGTGALEVRVRGDAAALLDPLELLGGPPPGLVVDHAPGEPLRITQVIAAGIEVL